MKVQDLAKQLKKPTKEFIRFLAEVDIKVKSGNTKLDEEMVVTIKQLFDQEDVKDPDHIESHEDGTKTVVLPNKALKVGDLPKRFNISLTEIMTVILQKGLLLNVNSEIDKDMATEIALELEIELKFEEDDKVSETPELKLKLDKITEQEIDNNIDDLRKRPPIITVMGHVDHGKTQLLDTIRKANVITGEAGGITQHIGAYQVKYNEQFLTFLDTPGHEAFTSLRARGAQVTDIAILVIAADDGVMPQSIEAIHHAKAANVPIIVAINKIDKPEADIEKCKQQLSQHDLLAEDWGGKVIMAPVSAKENKGIDELLEMIMLTAELLELQANPSSRAKGVIIESQLSKQKGPVATTLIKSGTLNIGDHFSVGPIYGKVRAMLNDNREQIKTAPPGTPVELLGLNQVPTPGDILVVHNTEKEAKNKAEEESLIKKEEKFKIKTVSLETLSTQIEEGSIKKLNLIIKSDVNGSLEAIASSIEQIPTDEVSIHILHTGTGPVTENDVLLANASAAFIIAFNVSTTNEAKQLADSDGINIKTYSIIYEIIDDVKKAVEGLFKVEHEEIELGTAEVRDLFKFSKVGIIAGCNVQTGKILRSATVKILRKEKCIHEGKIHSLKRFKEDVKEVAKGYECGIVLEDYKDVEPGDMVHCFELREKRRTL